MKIAITGATGLVGRALVRDRLAAGDEVLALSRDPGRAKERLPAGAEAARFEVGDAADLARALAGVDAVVNLAGEPILARRWNAEVMEEIRASRVEGTRTVVRAIAAADVGPRVLVNASATGYYGPRDPDDPVDEDAAPGDDYLASVCVEWEAAANEARESGVRVVIVRIGVVLSKEEGALSQMVPPFRWFVGGPIGSGRQGFPWVHIDDVAGAIAHALANRDVSGPLNLVAPGVPSNREFAKTLGRVLRRPSWLPVPRLALRLKLGKVSRVLTTGQFPVPRRTREAGYEFRFEDAERALRDLLAN